MEQVGHSRDQRCVGGRFAAESSRAGLLKIYHTTSVPRPGADSPHGRIFVSHARKELYIMAARSVQLYQTKGVLLCDRRGLQYVAAFDMRDNTSA